MRHPHMRTPLRCGTVDGDHDVTSVAVGEAAGGEGSRLPALPLRLTRRLPRKRGVILWRMPGSTLWGVQALALTGNGQAI
jgi:hypothetical protein